MFPYDIPRFTRDRLRQYKGFENMSDEMLDKAIDAMYTLMYAYLRNKIAIDEYHKKQD